MIDARWMITMVAAMGGALSAGPICGPCAADARLLTSVVGAAAPAEVGDTATVRLHISGMTCASCVTTARVALRRLDGVYSAEITLEDSVGVVRYDPQRVTPDAIVAHIARMTGYRAAVLPDGGRRQ